MTLKEAPVYNASLESENRLINLDHIQQVSPHANVPVDPGAADTPCCEVEFYSGTTIVVLVDYATMKEQTGALVGTIDTIGTLL